MANTANNLFYAKPVKHSSRFQENKSCGFFLMTPNNEFLLLGLRQYYDLPKGHMERGEQEIETAVRELFEETGIRRNDITIDKNFRFQVISEAGNHHHHRPTGSPPTKVFFLAQLKNPSVKIKLTEHDWFGWVPWNKRPQSIQKGFLDSTIDAVAKYLTK